MNRLFPRKTNVANPWRPAIALIAVSCLLPMSAIARQPLPRNVVLSVSMKSYMPDVVLSNREQSGFRVILNPGRLNSLVFPATEAYVGPFSSVYVTLRTTAPPDGVSILHIEAQLYNSSGQSQAVPVSLVQVYRFSKGYGQLTTFQEAYLNMRKNLNAASDKGTFPMGAGIHGYLAHGVLALAR